MAHAEKALDALGNPTRRQILQILARGPRPVGAIAAELPVSRPAVSKHLRILRAAALVVHEPQGTQNVFRLRREGFDDTQAWLGGFEVAAETVTTAAPAAPRVPRAINGASPQLGINGAPNRSPSAAIFGARSIGQGHQGAPGHPMPAPGVDRHEG